LLSISSTPSDKRSIASKTASSVDALSTPKCRREAPRDSDEDQDVSGKQQTPVIARCEQQHYPGPSEDRGQQSEKDCSRAERNTFRSIVLLKTDDRRRSVDTLTVENECCEAPF
jgi:hypothetical protein